MGRRIKAQPDGACHLERTPSGQGFCPAAKLVTAGDQRHWTELIGSELSLPQEP